VIFVDTGAFLARHVQRDQHHQTAVAAWQQLAVERLPTYTSNFVLDEAITLLARRTTYAFAAERATRIYASRSLKILRPGPEEELEALAVFRKFADQGVSFTDSVSFVLMRRQRLENAFTFDHHFERAGFNIWP
jgi:predicted nucleic acid-binding protein